MSKEESSKAIEPSELRPMLQAFNKDLGMYINDDQRHKLGRVLTIVDASIADPEQRKAIKDLINAEWWTRGNDRIGGNRMQSPHTDLRGICKALGFELYPQNDTEASLGFAGDFEEYAADHYRKISQNQ